MGISFQVQNFRLDGSESNYRMFKFRFDLAPEYLGREPDCYRLYRKHGSGPYLAVSCLAASSITAAEGSFQDGRFLPISTEDYRYYVRAEYLIDGVRQSSRPSRIVTVTPSIADVPKRQTISVFLFTPKGCPVPYDRSYVHSIVFDTAARSESFHNYMKEVSAGHGATAAAARLRAVEIDGTVRDWETMARDLSHYTGTRSYFDELKARGRIAALQREYPADHFVFVYNGRGGGMAFGSGVVFVGASEINDVERFQTIAHELGHAFPMKLDHTPAFYCPDGPFPEDLADWEECSVATYADLTNPMSASSTTHFLGYHKAILGFLNGKALFIDVPSGRSEAFFLFDSTTIHGENDNQLVLIKTDEYDSALVLEYRRPLGFNRFVNSGGTLRPAPEGVLVYYKPGRYDQKIPIGDLLVPYTYRSYRDPILITESQSFYDPHRALTIQVTRNYGHKVKVSVTRG